MSVRQLPHLQSRVLAELSDICDASVPCAWRFVAILDAATATLRRRSPSTRIETGFMVGRAGTP
jgi:hypothetical protein